jgi:hypothetical protein
MAFFYEIRSSNNAVLKRDGGFATQDAAKNVLQTRTPTGYTLSLERPPFSWHRLRLDNAVMPEKAAFFYFKSNLFAPSS